MTLQACSRSASSIVFQNGVPPFRPNNGPDHVAVASRSGPSQRMKSLSSGVAWHDENSIANHERQQISRAILLANLRLPQGRP